MPETVRPTPTSPPSPTPTPSGTPSPSPTPSTSATPRPIFDEIGFAVWQNPVSPWVLALILAMATVAMLLFMWRLIGHNWRHRKTDLKSLSFLGIQLTENQEAALEKIDKRLLIVEELLETTDVEQLEADFGVVVNESADYLRRLRDLEMRAFQKHNEPHPPPAPGIGPVAPP